MSEYKEMWQNAFNFKGRANRKDFWMAWLMNIVIIMVTVIVSLIFSLAHSKLLIILFYLYYFAMIIPFFSLSIRRLHDVGKSGWWYLISAVPIVGPIIYFVFLCTDSVGDNEWGQIK